MSLSYDKQLPHILIVDSIHEDGVALLRESLDVDVFTDLDTAALIDVLPRYDGLIVRRRTDISAEILQHAFRLKIIGNATPYLNNIDVAQARAQGIEVVNAPDANTVAVAEHTLWLLLALARGLLWRGTGFDAPSSMGMGLRGKTLGIIGFGRIGRQVAIRAQAFGMKVIVNQPDLTPELALEASVEAVDLYDLLAAADFVSLHVPLWPTTRGLIGSAELAAMKAGAYLINTAHAAVVDEAALFAALTDGNLAGAALDFPAGSTAPDPALASHPHVLLTPGIAAQTEDAAREAALAVAEQFLEFFATTDIEPILPLRIVPSERVFPHELFDQKRVDRLAKRMEMERILKNPPIVMETEQGYMVLDGATRSTALRQMGLPHMLVQVYSADTAGLQLKTWYHIIRQLDKADLLALLRRLPDIDLVDSDPETVNEALFEYGGLCYLHFVDGDVLLVKPKPDANRLDALNRLATTYIDAGHIDRTQNRELLQLAHDYDDMIALVVFPTFTVAQVIQVAQAGRRLPAGITRFIVPDRILRVNLDIDLLQADLPLRQKNRQLHEYLAEKQRRGDIRHYDESLYLLDE
ncbi:MAG: hypothetical protein M9930_06180 [Anaerolineae bacterium]|nr:hypothetical protein [Anaerolineae bacterium]